MSPCSPGRHAHRSGFTLVELLVVVLIIGILAAIALPRFLGQRTRAKNAAAQSAARHALVAARSYYTQQGESYAGLGPTQLQGYESSLGTAEPADTVKPGDAAANPQNIWIGNGLTGTNPDLVANGDPNGGNTVVLCSVGKGDTVYCVKDTSGVATYLSATNSSVSAAAGGTYSPGGWSAAPSSAPVINFTENFTDANNTSLASHTSDSSHTWTKTSLINGGNAIISNNAAINSVAGQGEYYYASYAPASADYSVFVDVNYRGSTANPDSIVAAVGRKSPSATDYTLIRLMAYRINSLGVLRFYLQAVSAGAGVSFTSVAAGTTESSSTIYYQQPSPSGTYTMELRMAGTTISGYINGVLRVEGVISGVTAAGRPGLEIYGDAGASTALTVDNMYVVG